MPVPTSLQVTFEHILVPTDFSGISENALEYAKAIARQANSQLTLVHVNSPVNPISPPEAAWIDPGIVLRQVAEQLEQIGAEMRSEGFRAGAFSVTGALRDEIPFIVRQQKIDLIVLGTHDKKGLERLLLGSDAESILRQVSCPVITIGPAVLKPAGPVWRPASVVCATTLEPDTASTAAYAYELAQQYGAQFEFLTVGGDKGKNYTGDWLAFEDKFKRCLPADSHVQPHLRTLLSDRKPGFEIADYARTRHVDLIVMGARTASALATHFVHGTASRVFRDAPCPVMTLHGA